MGSNARPQGNFSRVKFGSCDRCPNTQSLTERLSNVGRCVIPRCMGAGPERALVGGSVQVDYITASVRIDRDEQDVCPADLARHWKWFESFFESRLYDGFERAIDVVIERRPEFAGEALRSVEHSLINEVTPSGVLRSHPKSSRRTTHDYVYYFVHHPDELPGKIQ